MVTAICSVYRPSVLPIGPIYQSLLIDASENASHHTAVARGQAFIDVHRGAPDIRQPLQNQRVQAIEENRAILKSITEVVVTMARQNIFEGACPGRKQL